MFFPLTWVRSMESLTPPACTISSVLGRTIRGSVGSMIVYCWNNSSREQYKVNLSGSGCITKKRCLVPIEGGISTVGTINANLNSLNRVQETWLSQLLFSSQGLCRIRRRAHPTRRPTWHENWTIRNATWIALRSMAPPFVTQPTHSTFISSSIFRFKTSVMLTTNAYIQNSSYSTQHNK